MNAFPPPQSDARIPQHQTYAPQHPAYAPQPVPPYPTYQPAPQGTNGLAIASLVLGIIWLYWVGSVLAVIFGHVALGQMKRSGNRSGSGLAVAGLVLGYIGIATLALVVIVGASASSSGGY